MFTHAVDAYVRSVDDVRKLQDDWAKNDRGSISGPVIEFFGRTHLPGMQTAGQVIGQGTTHEMARIEGVADDDSFTKILERAGIGAVSSLAGSLVGGKLAPKFAPWLQGRVTDGLATRLGAPKDLMDKIVVHVMLEDGSGVVAETMTQSALDWAVFSRKLELEALDWDDFENELARGSFDHLVANVAEDLVAHSSGHGHVVWDPGSSRWRDTLNGRYAPRPSYMHRGQVREAFMRHVHSH